MNNAPEYCDGCPVYFGCPWKRAPSGYMDPGPDCPFVRLDEQAKLLQDPTAVLTMILRGTIARPDGMQFYDEWSMTAAALENLREACVPLLAALLSDYGDPDDYDGPVGYTEDACAEIELTFEMIAALRQALGGDS
jgi:hypothetical protein